MHINRHFDTHWIHSGLQTYRWYHALTGGGNKVLKFYKVVNLKHKWKIVPKSIQRLLLEAQHHTTNILCCIKVSIKHDKKAPDPAACAAVCRVRAGPESGEGGGEREAITWCIRSPRIWRNDNSDSDRSRPFVLNANGSRPSECRWQLREVGLWRLSRCNSSENRGRGNQTHSMAPLTAALEKNGSLWQTLDLISFELHAADQAQWVGAAQASDQRSLITPEVRGHHEVIMRSSQAGGVTWSRQIFNVNDNSVAGSGLCSPCIWLHAMRSKNWSLWWWGSRVITSSDQAPVSYEQSSAHYHYQDKLLIRQMTFISPRHLNCYKLVWPANEHQNTRPAVWFVRGWVTA